MAPNIWRNGPNRAHCTNLSETNCDGFRYRTVSFRGLDCQGYRLPTGTEWEYAARACTESAFHCGEIQTTECGRDSSLDRIGWYCGNSDVYYSGSYDASGYGGPTRAGTHPVGGKTPNRWGLYDMSGNVFEWVSDWYGDYPTSSVNDPIGPPSGTMRVLRGGSWLYFSLSARSANRYVFVPSARYLYAGFRLARTVP